MAKSKSFLESVDFAKGWKTVSGLMVAIASMYASAKGLDIEIETIKASLVDLGLAFGTILSVFGFFMKVIRDLKK